MLFNTVALLGQECYYTTPSNSSAAQTLGCPSPNSSTYHDTYEDKANFMPTTNWNQPIKTINVNFVVVQKNDGSGNFSEHNPDHVQFLNDAFTGMQNDFMYSDIPIQPMTDICGNDCFNMDTRVRFELHNIYWAKDNSLYFNNVKCPTASFRYPIAEEDQVMTVYWLDHILESNNNYKPTGGCAYIPVPEPELSLSYNGKRITMINYYHHKFGPSPNPFLTSWKAAGVLGHEFGHTFYLGHVYDLTHCTPGTGQFLPDVFNNPPEDCPMNQYCNPNNPNIFCTNAFMGEDTSYNNGRYVRPLQQGTIHQALMMRTVGRFAEGYDESKPWVITEDETWDFGFKLYQDIIIEPGATLTITCQTQMPPNAKIIVKPGATLIVDGGTITNWEGHTMKGLWRGVELWGDVTKSQFLQNGQPQQPKVRVINGGEISNAQDAITTWKTNDLSTTGGIVQCDGAVFRNNRRAIEFWKYRNFPNHNPNATYRNLSYVHNSQFITDAPLAGNKTPLAFITAWEVNGISIKGNTFENTNPNATAAQDFGKGIYTEDAQLLIEGCNSSGCLPQGACCNQHPNIFRNLAYGVQVKNINGHWNTIIDGNQFEHCFTGIKSDGVNNLIASRNQFQMGQSNYPISVEYGIWLNSGTAYRVEENSFEETTVSPRTCVGIWAKETGGDPNEIYKNSFEKMDVGNYASGLNRNPLDDPSPTDPAVGLEFICNAARFMTGNDIAVNAFHPNDGVAQFQGNLTGSNPEPAGNVFTQSSNSNWFDVYNGSPDFGVYVYYDNAVQEKPLIYQNITPVSIGDPNLCESYFVQRLVNSPIGTGVLNPQVVNDLTVEYAQLNNNYQNFQQLLSSLIDGGNSQQTQHEVDVASQQDAQQLRNELLGESPYLSREVLEQMAERDDILSDAVIYEILSNNPDGLRDAELMEFLRQQAYGLPEWMLQSLEQMAESQLSMRTYLESQLSYFKAAKGKIAHIMVQHHQAASLNNQAIDYTAMRNWLAGMNSPWADYRIAESYIAEDNYSAASSLLQNMDVYYGLEGKTHDEWGSYRQVFNVLDALKAANRSLKELNESELQTLETIADAGHGIASVKACNLLAMNMDESPACDMQIEMPYVESGKKGREENTVEIPTDQLKLFPNPVSDLLGVHYSFPRASKEIQWIMYDVRGVMVLNGALNGNQGMQNIDVQQLERGTYFLKVIGTEVLEEQSFVKQ